MNKYFRKIYKGLVYIWGLIVLFGYKTSAWADSNKTDGMAEPDYGVINTIHPLYGVPNEPVGPVHGTVDKITELGAVAVLGISVVLIGVVTYIVIRIKKRNKNNSK